MAYTPQLSIKYSGTLRRIAWAYGLPMTKTIERLFGWVVKYVDGEKVCEACKDNSFCEMCLFNQAIGMHSGGEICKF